MAKKIKTEYDSTLKALSKFVNDFPESRYINNGFYTNKNIFIKNAGFSEIPNEFKVLKEPYSKLLNIKEVEDKFINDFKNKKYIVRKMDRSEFKKFYLEIKRFGFEQIRIVNGKFKLYDEYGHSKWSMTGQSEELKNFLLDFDYKLFKDILYAINELNPIEVKFFSYKTYLIIKLIAKESITIYARGVILESDKPKKLEQQTLI